MVETSNYYQSEDEPDMSNPETALDMYQSQVASLQTVLEDAHAIVAEASKRLGGIHKFAEEKNLPKLADKALAAYEHVTKLHHLIQHQDAARRGADAVIAAVRTQRDEVVNELNELVGAIEMGDENHPKLADYASEIRDDEREYQTEAAEDYALDYAWETVSENAQDTIGAVLQRMGFSRARAYHYAGCFYEVINGDLKLTDEQAELLKQLVVQFDLPEYVLKTEAREAEMDVQIAQRYREAEIRREQQKAILDVTEFDTEDDAEELDVDD